MRELGPQVFDLAPDAIRAALGEGWTAPIVVLEKTRSTNDDAKELAGRGGAHGTVVVADEQTAGRGRGTHTWFSPPGTNLYMSMILRPKVAPADVAPITLAIGCAVLEATEAALGEGGRRAEIKWPNDVWIGGRKIGGILVEGQLRGGTVTSLVAGIGLNVRGRAFPGELGERATSLAIEGAGTVDRSAIAGAIVRAVMDATARFEGDGLRPFVGLLNERNALRGTWIEVGGEAAEVVAIDAGGRLIARTREGVVREIFSGEVISACRS